MPPVLQPVDQPDLFAAAAEHPPGFAYRQALICPQEEQALLATLAALPFKPFNFQGHLANRHVVNFGLRYDYGDRGLHQAAPIPDFLLPLRERAADFAGRPSEAFVHVLINQYPPGAGIGWHRDKAYFGEVVGVSLGAPCTLRFRLRKGAGWIRRNAALAPRSAYVLTGAARHDWEHSIAPMSALRYSITLRTLAG